MVKVDEGARVAQARASEGAEPGRKGQESEGTVLEAAFASRSAGKEGGRKGGSRLDANLGTYDRGTIMRSVLSADRCRLAPSTLLLLLVSSLVCRRIR